MTTGERLAAELRRAWKGEPWHGPSTAAVLARLTAKQAAHRRARGSHTPWELLLHLTAWVEAPIGRFDDPALDLTSEANFPAPAATDDAQWAHDCAALGDAVERLARRVESLPDDVLAAPVGVLGYNYVTMIDGVAQHLAYHTGQMALLALKEETAGVIAPPPLIGLGAMAIAEGLQRLLAWPIGVSHWIGYPIALVGVGLIMWAIEHFEKSRTPAEPWKPSRSLVLGGPYRITRNPMYIGFLIAQAGIGFMRGNAWYLALLVPVWAMLHWGVVLREERYLLKKFGASYQQLLDRTRRWLA